jgi:hypothetical protein
MKGRFLGRGIFNFGLGVLLASFLGCGSPQTSTLDWEQSRSDTKRYAYLWDRDLEDEFLLGITVLKTKDFVSSALNFQIDPYPVRLKLNPDKSKLHVLGAKFAEKFLSFDVGKRDDRYEIDFASVGNDLVFHNFIDTVGGAMTLGNMDGQWMSAGTPKVINIDQDNHTLVVDMEHRVVQVLVTVDPNTGEERVKEVLSPNAGIVHIRMFLKRSSDLPQLAKARSVGDALAQNIGYFPASFKDFGKGQALIQRFPIQEKGEETVTFYLKDFPEEYVEVGKEAVLSWNKAFDNPNQIEVKIATDAIDAGDPRYHVIKWFSDVDETIGWAGVARMNVDPATGLVMGGDVYINGGNVLKMYESIHAFTKKASKVKVKPIVKMGGIVFEQIEGEFPVIPFFTDSSMSLQEYMQGYYFETIAHEVGHVLGLRHNFLASTVLDDEGHPASVMDYAPRHERHKIGGPQSYDIAAIRWGYYDELPESIQPFCTDEDVEKVWNCSKDDHGDTVRYSTQAVLGGLALLEQSNIKIEKTSWISAVAYNFENIIKMMKLKHQIPASQRETALSQLNATVTRVMLAKPHRDLKDEDRVIVEKNLKLLQAMIDY